MDLETTTTLPDRTVTIHRNKTAAPPLPKQMALGAPHPFRWLSSRSESLHTRKTSGSPETLILPISQSNSFSQGVQLCHGSVCLWVL